MSVCFESRLASFWYHNNLVFGQNIPLLNIFLNFFSDLRTESYLSFFSPSDKCRKLFHPLEPVPPSNLDAIVSPSVNQKPSPRFKIPRCPECNKSESRPRAMNKVLLFEWEEIN